jgi:AraC-like DNA-binding protein
MGSAVAGRGVVLPERPARVPGVRMAGFRDHGGGPVDVRVVRHPAVSMMLEFGAGPHVVDAVTGRRHRGNLAVGYMHAPSGYGVTTSSACRCGCPRPEPPGRDPRRPVGPRCCAAARTARRGPVVGCPVRPDRSGVRPSAYDRTDRGPRGAWAWARITGSRGRVRIDALAAELGWNRRRLWSRFGAQIGQPPKRAAKLIRFDRAVHRLAAGEDAAGVAAGSGYVDQSHCTGTCRRSAA